MSAYVVVHATINDQDKMQAYGKAAGPTVAEHGGKVEFRATYRRDGERMVHHEIAEFRKAGDIWYFTDGKLVGPGQYTRETPKVGRNEPCPCGSGKKYKKCCGR